MIRTDVSPLLPSPPPSPRSIRVYIHVIRAINRGQSPLIKSNFDGYTFVTVHSNAIKFQDRCREAGRRFLNLLCRYLRGASNRFLRREIILLGNISRRDYRRIYAVPAVPSEKYIGTRVASTLASRLSFFLSFSPPLIFKVSLRRVKLSK